MGTHGHLLRWTRNLLVAAAVLAAGGARAEIAVIVHPDSAIESLSTEQVANLYLGRARRNSLAKTAQLLDHPNASPLRERFFQNLVGMSLARVNAYWARLQFSGDIQPPLPRSSDLEVVDAVARNRNAIGYIDSGAISPSVRVVLRIDG